MTEEKETAEQEVWTFLIYHGINWCEYERQFVLKRAGVTETAQILSAEHNVPPDETMTNWFVKAIKDHTKKQRCAPTAICEADHLGEEADGIREYAELNNIPFIVITRDELYGNHPKGSTCPQRE